MLLHTVIVDGYDVKFDKTDSIIKITIPNNECFIDLSTDNHNLNAAFVDILKDLNWTQVAILKLQDFILSECQQNGTNICVAMNIQTGKIKRI